MLFIGIEHKDTYFKFAFTAEQLKELKFLFDHATIDYNSEDEPLGITAEKYLHGEFYPVLKDIIEGE